MEKILGFSLLNGDCLAHSLETLLPSNRFLVFRECLIDHDNTPHNPKTFWETRMRFMVDRYQITPEEYKEKTILEFEKIQKISPQEPVYLWFEFDLFCQVNFWFLVHDLSSRGFNNLFWVHPSDQTSWKGFSESSLDELVKAWKNAIPLTSEWIQTSCSLWISFQNQDWIAFKKTYEGFTAWPKLTEIGGAQMERLDLLLGKPQRIIQSIRSSGITDFPTLFQLFQIQAGEYGFGDCQVLHILQEMDKK